jgi:hypothetical protein
MDAQRRVAEAAALRFLRDGGADAVPFTLDPDEYVAWQGLAHWDFVADALSEAGFDPARAEDVIAEAIEWANELDHATTQVAFNGGGNSDELAAARTYLDAYLPARVPPSRPDWRPRVRRGHAPRTGSNGRTRGSRRCTGSGSRAGPDDPDPESDTERLSPLPVGARADDP